VLDALVGPDPRDPATADSEGRLQRDYRPFLDPGGLQGARIGIPREVFYEYSPPAARVAEQAIEALRAAGAEVVDPADIPGAREMAGFTGERELEVLLYELKHDLDAYLAERGDRRIRSLADVIAYNEVHADTELRHFGQEFLVAAQAKGPLTDPAYLEALASNRRLSREQGVDKVLQERNLDALLVPTSSPPWTIDLVNGDHVLGEGSTPAALAGYPAVSVPAGYADGLPVGITFFGTAWSEPALIRLAYAFEQATKVRRPPRFRSGGVSPTGRP
jgi:amidase